MVPESADLALEQSHAGDGEGGVAALVALVAAGAGEGLVHVVAGDDAEGAGDAGLQLHLLDTTRRLGADEVVMVGLAADDDAEAGDATGLSASPPRSLDVALGSERKLVGTGDGVFADQLRRNARDLKALLRALYQPLRQVLV